MQQSATETTVYQDDAPRRDWWQAVKRGFSGRCPHCGEGRMFRAFLKVDDTCPVCGEELHHHRADDFPPYLTIVIVGHILGGLLLSVHESNLNPPVWIEALLWPLAGLLMCLWFLPRIKGSVVGYQWALRMHGFEIADHHAGRGHAAPAPAIASDPA